ncbi:MAG: GNAT family N-acetyltransferase [Oscillospiraceae bacterium]|nr:GNAT family N-acetyltransferase [Oscillospiraceae bacterium]
MDIRFAKPQDVDGIISLLRQVGQVHREGRPDIFRAGAQKYSPEQVLCLLSSPDKPIFIAAEGDLVLGYGFCQLKAYQNDPVIADHKTLYIDDLCVDENCRGKSVGKKLYQEICRYAKQQGCYNVTLNVWSCNPTAMRFYEKLGLMPQKIGMEQVLDAEEK